MNKDLIIAKIVITEDGDMNFMMNEIMRNILNEKEIEQIYTIYSIIEQIIFQAIERKEMF